MTKDDDKIVVPMQAFDSSTAPEKVTGHEELIAGLERPLLTDWDIAALNAARTVLDEFMARCIRHHPDKTRLSRSLGHVEALAEAAEWAVFQFINHADTRLDLGLTQAQIHNHKELPS